MAKQVRFCLSFSIELYNKNKNKKTEYLEIFVNNITSSILYTSKYLFPINIVFEKKKKKTLVKIQNVTVVFTVNSIKTLLFFHFLQKNIPTFKKIKIDPSHL